MFLVFFMAIFVHEIGHILYYLINFKEYPNIRVRTTNIAIIPQRLMSKKQKQQFLAWGIIFGLIPLYPFFFIHSLETTYVLIAYLIASGADFYNIIKLEVKNGE